MSGSATNTRTNEASAVAAELVEAFSAGDWSRFRETLAPNVVYTETGTQRRVEGVDDYVELSQGWRSVFPDARGTVRATLTDGSTVVQEITWEGTQRGPLPTPTGTVPASNKRIRVAATMWYEIADGRAREIRHHLDVMSLLTQIGAMPGGK
jgi:steroid delta-isomerase-like uncharacterized protein